ncbi:MAG: VWA domain-containing protein, partial [Anaerolineaceae bacterium]|nr:VWA domain-containing protein [Anaerolineaceae bacterium]
MDQRIVQFIKALRALGVRISLAESQDAFRAIDELGIQDRETFRTLLRTTLIKDAQDIPHFERLFPMFFQSNQPQMQDANQELSQDEAKKLAQALQQLTQDLREMLQKLFSGEPLTPQEMEKLDQMVNADQMNDMRYQQQLARQMEQALKFREVREALEALLQMLQEMGMSRNRLQQIREMLDANQRALQEQLFQHAGERILRNMSQQPRDRLNGLYNRPFQNISEDDMQVLRREVQRLAAALRTRLALRLRRAHNGQLDVKGTLRANLKYGSVPVELKHRSHTLKPKIVVICDISTSMRHVSELMLSLLFAIQSQVSKTSAFTFIDHLEYVSPEFAGRQPGRAVADVLKRQPSGYYNTDFGSSIEDLVHDHLDKLDTHSTVIIVGDARNNYNDPKLELFRKVSRRSRATIWLNPETKQTWGTGDSDMLR